jgi:hypothetical protein
VGAWGRQAAQLDVLPNGVGDGERDQNVSKPSEMVAHVRASNDCGLVVDCPDFLV